MKYQLAHNIQAILLYTDLSHIRLTGTFKQCCHEVALSLEVLQKGTNSSMNYIITHDITSSKHWQQIRMLKHAREYGNIFISWSIGR